MENNEITIDLNITKTALGFIFNGINLEFVESKQYDILNETACHVHTTRGIMYFDTSVTIEGQSFELIEDWVTELYR